MQIEQLREQLRQLRQPDVRRFHALMARRIRTILMVSTQYEAFSLAWDGSLTEDVYGAYSLLHLQNLPQITTITSGREALEVLAREKFDLVLVSSNLADMSITEFGRAVKAGQPDLPVVMLVFALGDAPDVWHNCICPGIDYVFCWQGNAKVLFSIIKLVEDSLNVERDTRIVPIGVLLAVEDSIRQYSFFLPHLYTLLMKQAFALVPYGVDENERQLRTRTRPKLLLARSFEEAKQVADRYGAYLHGVISDMEIGAGERAGPRAALAFLRDLQARRPGAPLLLMSADDAAPAAARELGIRFVSKRSPRFIRDLEDFFFSDLGFGEFVFRDAAGREIARARTLRDFEQTLRRVPLESVEFHCRRNHFSHWLLAQGEAGLAEILRPLQTGDFESSAAMRDFLCEAVECARRDKHRGIVTDFRAEDFDPEYTFLMTGRGSLGGKARGLAFMLNVLCRSRASPLLAGVEIKLPRTLIITTDAFDEFMAQNDLESFAMDCADDRELRARFCRAKLPESLHGKLQAYVERVRVPLAVRSSSHLEDSSNQPFAGLYETYMLPNSHPDAPSRLEQLCRAVKLVYASAFTVSIKNYFQTLNLNMEEEKMAVIVQEIVGRRHGNLFYPTISGVAQSFNYYPFARMAPADGLAAVALGFGKIVVEGGDVLRFSPRHPNLLPQSGAVSEMLQNSQKNFYALDLDDTAPDLCADQSSNLKLFELERAERDSTLHPVGSVISAEDDRVVDDLAAAGPRIVSFAPILKRRLFPLCDALNALLELGQASLGSHVEIEFAVNIDFLKDSRPEFFLLQIRPMSTSRERLEFQLDTLPPARTVCRCRRVMGNGVLENIHDVIYCHPARFDFNRSRRAAETIGRLNQELLREHRRYVLLGPGRWGTRVPALGVPVNWQQVAGAAVIVELPAAGRRLDPSQGAHFFHNLAATGIGYFSLAEHDAENFVNWEFFESQTPVFDDGLVRRLRLAQPLAVYIDALNQRGAIASGG